MRDDRVRANDAMSTYVNTWKDNHVVVYLRIRSDHHFFDHQILALDRTSHVCIWVVDVRNCNVRGDCGIIPNDDSICAREVQVLFYRDVLAYANPWRVHFVVIPCDRFQSRSVSDNDLSPKDDVLG